MFNTSLTERGLQQSQVENRQVTIQSSVAFAFVVRHGSACTAEQETKGNCQHKRRQWNLQSAFSTRLVGMCLAEDCLSKAADQLAGLEQDSEYVLGYMVKQLSAYGGCLGSKRR